MFLNGIIGERVFNCELCGGRPGKSREFKHTVGKCTPSFSSATVDQMT